ncbi:hypothetical protein [Neisseria shayeganii]|nr:hypothetical protein [Neisseria shayeganii]
MADKIDCAGIQYRYQRYWTKTAAELTKAGLKMPDGGKLPEGKYLYLVVKKDGKDGAVIVNPEYLADFENKYAQAREAKMEKIRQETKAREEELERKIPGLSILRNAYYDINAYHDAFNRMMEDEQNDGVRPPKAPQADIEALEQQYPVAKVYLKACDYSDASNYQKAGAGRQAKILLESGGSIEEANKILDNWLPEGAIWD